MKQRVKSQRNFQNPGLISQITSPTQSAANYRQIVRKPTTKQFQLVKRNNIQSTMDIRYFTPRITYQQVLQYLKNMKFTESTPKVEKENLQMHSVTSLKIDGYKMQETMPIRTSEFVEEDKIILGLQERRDSANLLLQTNRNQKERKTYRQNAKEGQKQEKLIMKSFEKIRAIEEDLRSQVRKNNQLQQTNKLQANKIIYLEKQLQLKSQMLTKNGKKADKSQLDQLRYRNNELESENRQIKSMLHRVTQELKYYQIQAMMLRKKKHDTINLEMKCLKLNEKNRYLQQKIQRFSVNKSSSKLNHNQSEKVLKVQSIEGDSLFMLTPEISPDITAQKPLSSCFKKNL